MLKFLKNLLPKNASEKSITYTSRQGKAVEVDDAFKAWTSGNLDEMLKALNSKTNPIDRHFLLMGIVAATYKNRSEAKMAELCTQISETHIFEFKDIAPVLKVEMDGVLPRVTTFQYFATLLVEQKKFQKAIDVCKVAISYGLHDNTTSGFQGRIKRIEKMMNLSN